METLNLHFALSDEKKELFVQAHGKTQKLESYTDNPHKFKEHTTLNSALAMIPPGQQKLITHFVEGIDLPIDSVTRLSIVTPSNKADDILPDLVAVHMHIPQNAYKKTLLTNTHEAIPFPLVLETLGVKQHLLTATNSLDIHSAASLIISGPLSTARSIISHHPDLGTVDVDVAGSVFKKHMQDSNDFTQLVNFISSNPDSSQDPWYVKSYSIRIDPDTLEEIPMEPTDEQFADGEQVDWPTLSGTDTKVVPLYSLSDEQSGSPSGGVISAATEAVCSILKKVKNDETLKGGLWSRPQGIISKQETKVVSNTVTNIRNTNGKFTVKHDSDSAYGLDLFWDKFSFNNNTVSFPMRNNPNRFLSVYVEYLRADNSPIPWSELKNTREGNDLVVPDGLVGPVFAEMFAKHHNNDATTKIFWGMLSAGNQVFGIPFWTDPVDINFKWPHDKDGVAIASKANVYLGGLGYNNGFKDWDSDVDLGGLIATGLISFGVSAASLALTIKVLGPLQKKLKSSEFYNAILALSIGLGVGSAVLAVILKKGDIAKTILSKLSNVAAGVMFGKITELLLEVAYKRAIIDFQRYCFVDLTAQQVIQQAPFAGWALKVASVVSDLATMAATTIQCGLSPATYKYQVESVMNVNVQIKPDPNHGTIHQDPIWPMVADHWVIMLKYPKSATDTGGITYVKAGPMPAKHSEPLIVTFENVPTGGKVEISAVVYSKEDWIAGRWDSGPKVATPDKDNKLDFSGAIVESLVPLVSTTKYTEKQRTGFDTILQKHTWVMTTFAIKDIYKDDLQKGILSKGFYTEFSNNGILLPANADIKITTKETDKHWEILNKINNIVYRCFYVEIYNNGETGDKKVVLYQITVENLTRPAPPLPFPKTVCDSSGSNHNICQLVNISINNKAYQLGYVWKASGMNLPKDKTTNPVVNTQMYNMQSISTLNQPSDLIIQSRVGFSEMPFIAYNQFGLTPLFQINFETGSTALNSSDNKAVPAIVAKEFELRGFTIPANALIKVTKRDIDWRITDGETIAYNLIVTTEVVDGAWKKVISIFNYIVPEFTDFYLDSRIDTDGRYHLRSVSFNDGIPGAYKFDTDFDPSKKNSWGSFPIPKGSSLYKIAVHPGGYVIGIDFGLNKIWKLKLNEHASTMKDASVAAPLSGAGNLEGLLSQPKGLTIAADGRIIILEEGNKRFQSFDINGNPVAAFKGTLAFNILTGVANSLDKGEITEPLRKAYQENVPASYFRKMLFNINDDELISDLDKGIISDDLKYYFKKNLHELSENNTDTIIITKPGALWLISKKEESVSFDLRWDKATGNLNVYYEGTLKVDTIAKTQEWLITDPCNSLTFKATKSKPTSPDIQLQQLIATANLRDQTVTVEYLDIAIEDKGYIYVLYAEGDGSTADKYRLDIYKPDGTILLGAPLSGIAAAKMAVDKWRTLWTLNYEKYLGPDNRTEPTVSGWIPSTTKSK